MFFPCLEVLKKERVPEPTVNIFDWWLGTRRQNTLSSLNPLQFALDCGIRAEEALKIFSYSVFDQRISLLRRRFIVYCPACNHKVKSLFDPPQENCTCPNCCAKIPVGILDDCTEIKFELLKAPQDSDNSFLPPRGIESGKAPSLRISSSREFEESEIRRLFDMM